MKNPMSIHNLVLLGGVGVAIWQSPRIASWIDVAINELWNPNPEFAYRASYGVTTVEQDLAVARAITEGTAPELDPGALESLEAILDEGREARQAESELVRAEPDLSIETPAEAQAPALAQRQAKVIDLPDVSDIVRSAPAETGETIVGRAFIEAVEGSGEARLAAGQPDDSAGGADAAPDLMLPAAAMPEPMPSEHLLAGDGRFEPQAIDDGAFSLASAWVAHASGKRVVTAAQGEISRLSFPVNWKLGLRAPPLVIIGPEGSGLAPETDDAIADAFRDLPGADGD